MSILAYMVQSDCHNTQPLLDKITNRLIKNLMVAASFLLLWILLLLLKLLIFLMWKRTKVMVICTINKIILNTLITFIVTNSCC